MEKGIEKRARRNTFGYFNESYSRHGQRSRPATAAVNC